MKKILLALAILLFAFAPSFSDEIPEVELESVSQIMVPKEIFIGDAGQLQYSFRTQADFFAFLDPSLVSENELKLNFENFDFLAEKDSCTIKDAVLFRNGSNYNLCITLIPWKTGRIEFREFDLFSVCSGKESSKFTLMIKLNPIQIPSLAEKLGVSNIRAPAPPITLPGTKYLLWLVILLVILFFVLVALVIIKLQKIVKKIRLIKNKIGFYRNAKSVKHRLTKLLKPKLNLDDSTFAMEWQKIMRSYLDFRFASTFASVTGSKIASYIQKITGNLAEGKELEAIEELSSIFIRTDYIRFASGSIDSQLLPAELHQAVFAENERKSIVEKSFKIIDVFEHGTNENDDESKNQNNSAGQETFAK